MKKLLILMIMGLFVCCEPRETIYVNGPEDFVIIGIDPPKRFSLDLKRVRDGMVFRGIYISKRCSGLNIKVGDVIPAILWLYKRGDYTWYEFDTNAIRDILCY